MLNSAVNLVQDLNPDPTDAKKMYERWGPCAMIVDYVSTDTTDTEYSRYIIY